MRPTVPFPVSELPVKAEGVLSWINDEAQKVFRQLRAFANMLSFDYGAATTTGTAVDTVLWTSPVMPKNATWNIFVLAAGVSVSGDAERSGYAKAGTFESTAGTVAQVSTTSSVWTHESDAAMSTAFSVNATARTISFVGTDNGASPMRFTCVVITAEALPA